jgi:hypothetical protein
LYNHDTSSYHEITFAIQNGPTSPSTRKYKPRRTTAEKVDTILKFIKKDTNWLLSGFLFYLFSHENEKGEESQWVDHQVKVVGRFLAGKAKHSLAKIVHLCLKLSYGLPLRSSPE